jgi:hypothetical protein
MNVTPRRQLAAGAMLCVLGLAVAGTAPIAGTPGSARTEATQTLGGVLLLVGWAVLAWGIHRLGRSS